MVFLVILLIVFLTILLAILLAVLLTNHGVILIGGVKEIMAKL